MTEEPLFTEASDELVKVLLKYVYTVHRDKRGGAQRLDRNDAQLDLFKDWASYVFAEMGLEYEDPRFWCSMLTRQDTDGEWCAEFPHNHGWNGTTLVLSLQAPEEGGDLVILENDEEEHRIPPSPGQAYTIGGHDDHGVERIIGDTPRVAIIVTAFPKGGMKK